jgi:hypothetical protein
VTVTAKGFLESTSNEVSTSFPEFTAMTVSVLNQANLDTQGLLLAFGFAEAFAAAQLTEEFDIFDVPGVIFLEGDVSGTMTDTLRARFLNLGYAIPMAATANEDTELTASSVGDSNSDVIVARRGLMLSQGALGLIVDPRSMDPERIGLTMAGSFRAGRMDLLATVVKGSGMGTSVADGTDYNDLDDIYYLMYLAAVAGVSSNMTINMLLHPHQVDKIRQDARSEVGPNGWRMDLQELQNFKGAGHAGRIFGSVDLYQTNNVVNETSKYKGGAWVEGGLNYAIGSPSAVLREMMGQIVASDPGVPMTINIDPEPRKAQWHLVANGFDGVAVREAARTWKFYGKST